MPTSKKILLLASLIAVSGAGVMAADHGPGYNAAGRTQEALDSLAQGQNADAEELAQEVISHRQPLSGRCWLIVAAARMRTGKFAAAEDAYRSFLDNNKDGELRQYAAAQIQACQAARDANKGPVAPSKRLVAEALAELAKVDTQDKIESSLHFVVHSRNAQLSKLMVVEAEAALTRICGMLMGPNEYPNRVEIRVWTDRKEYDANAVDAPEWAGGSYSLTVKDGLMTRRIDLTQLDKDGHFSTEMLDRILPHEMCHLVTRELFGDAPCPLFMNEGLAMLSESETDNGRVMLAGTALAGNAKLPLAELLLTQRHNLKNVDVFYAESYSLVAFLQGRLSERQFKDLLNNMKLGCSFKDALHRALYMPQDNRLLPAIIATWESHAIEQAQYLRALKGEYELAMAR